MVPNLSHSLLWILASSHFCLGAIYNNAAELPELNYDFVVVGGNTVANRLTENPRLSVLVLEAGVSNEGVLDSIVPYFLVNGRLLEDASLSWNFTTTPQEGLYGHVLPYPRGFILGGCSSINSMMYTRGSSDDFDRYANFTGDPGWSWNNLQPYIRKVDDVPICNGSKFSLVLQNERWTLPADHHNAIGQFNPAVHSLTGINSVSLPGFQLGINDRVIRTTQELPDEFPFNLDMNSGKPLGVGWLQTTIKDGKRSSSATSYLGPEFIKRPNLHVLLNARVLRLVQTGSGRGGLEFKEIEFSQDQGVHRIRVSASREVIFSAGTVGTPSILMHSGIGDKAELSAVGIKTLVDLPSVGKNVSDHPFSSIAWSVNSNNTLDDLNNSMGNTTASKNAFNLWETKKLGPFVGTSTSHIAWTRLPQTAPIFKVSPDPSAGPNSAHIELIIQNNLGLTDSQSTPQGHFTSVGVAVVSPSSRGSIKLSSNDPFAPPLIDPGLLNSPFDIFTMRNAIKSPRKFMSAPAWKDYIIGPASVFANATTDSEIDDVLRKSTISTCHLVGSCGMSAPSAKYGVVNPDLLVKGASGLRIIDASVMPFVPGAHTQAATYIIAERGADLVKAA